MTLVGLNKILSAYSAYLKINNNLQIPLGTINTGSPK